MESSHPVLGLHLVKSLRHRGVVGLASIGEGTVDKVHDSRVQGKVGVEEEREHGLVLPVARHNSIVATTSLQFRWVQPFFL